VTEQIDIRRLLTIGLLAAALPGLALSAEDAELEAVVVTGSRIPKIQTEGPSPVTTITAEEIQARGFTTLQEVANSLTQITGTAQNETQAGSFTQNANSLELRGLGPGRTLILLDGRRLSDYPLPYNGESNFVNLSSIPVAAIERIELLSSGASAIYGSDAVAGVFNIVLKKKLDSPLTVELRRGFTSQGGGSSTRVQALTGGSSGNLNVLFAGEVLTRKPIFGYQRKFQDSIYDDPTAGGDPTAARALLRLDPFDLDEDGDLYIDPGEAACEPFSRSTSYVLRDGFGHYCGQYDDPAQISIRNARKHLSAFTALSYQMGGVELYSNLNYTGAKDRDDTNYSWFTNTIMGLSDSGYLFDTSIDPIGLGGTVAGMQRFFHPWEIGGRRAREERWDERALDYNAGIRGSVIGDWKYDLTLGGSTNRVKNDRPMLLNQRLIDYYLGPQLGEIDLSDPGDPPFVLPVYDVVLEAASQSYDIALTDALANGEYFGIVGTGGGGKRNRYALGVEWSIPVLEPLRVQLAGRYERYDDITDVNGAVAYNAGVEYRPIKQLLIRGSYATSFRAPDMHYVFADPSGFFATATDEYRCRRDFPNTPLPQCPIEPANPEGARQGNPFLKEETGKSYNFGFVAAPLPDLTFTADYFNIKLDDAVKDDSVELLLTNEADCRLGQTKGGTPVDINSLKCQSALARIQRRAADGSPLSEELTNVITGPINSAMLKTSGFDLKAEYRLNIGAWGTFEFDASFSQVRSNKRQEFEGDEVQDLLETRSWPDWHSRMSASIGWERGPIVATVFVQRYGHIWNWNEDRRLPAYVLTNFSARYNNVLGSEVYVGVAIQNLFNRNPPRDPTWSRYPYYSDWNYSPVGREMFFELGLRL
jgi:iron complex outermembrane receptor protein